MTKIEQEAIADFIRRKGVTKCPTACAGHTQARLRPDDVARLDKYYEAKEAARPARSPYGKAAA